MEAATRQSGLVRALAIFFAQSGAYLVGVLWLAALFWRRNRLTRALVVRMIIMVVLAYGLSKIGDTLVSDPRPYLVEGIPPLIPVAQDNGFPSDHTLLAASLTASLWWLDRRLLSPFALATVLVMLGRLGVGAHHTLDVVGSLVIVLLATVAAAWFPLPSAWDQPLLGRRLAQQLSLLPI